MVLHFLLFLIKAYINIINVIMFFFYYLLREKSLVFGRLFESKQELGVATFNRHEIWPTPFKKSNNAFFNANSLYIFCYTLAYLSYLYNVKCHVS